MQVGDSAGLCPHTPVGHPLVRLLLSLVSKELPRIDQVLASELLLCKYVQTHSPTLHHISGKGQNHSPNWRGCRVGENVFSVTAISHALEYPGESLLSSYY